MLIYRYHLINLLGANFSIIVWVSTMVLREKNYGTMEKTMVLYQKNYHNGTFIYYGITMVLWNKLWYYSKL